VKRLVLHPGDYHVTSQPITLSTLLGSCVSVCLYDPVRRVMGMNHFLLAERRYADGRPVLEGEAGRYGIHAMELLINQLLRSGAQRRYLRAKAFGGGSVMSRRARGSDGFLSVGTDNVRFVREFLRRDGIPLVAADLGGNFGRQIHFTGTDYSVYQRKIPTKQSRHLEQEERLYWKHRLERQANDDSPADFW
jgi:chemotaxis protein CheD